MSSTPPLMTQDANAVTDVTVSRARHRANGSEPGPQAVHDLVLPGRDGPGWEMVVYLAPAQDPPQPSRALTGRRPPGRHQALLPSR
jgi:hypothetical protein